MEFQIKELSELTFPKRRSSPTTLRTQVGIVISSTRAVSLITWTWQRVTLLSSCPQAMLSLRNQSPLVCSTSSPRGVSKRVLALLSKVQTSRAMLWMKVVRTLLWQWVRWLILTQSALFKWIKQTAWSRLTESKSIHLFSWNLETSCC